MTWIEFQKQLCVSVIGLTQKAVCRVTQIEMTDSHRAQL